MIDLIAKSWKDYELLDSGEGQRLERLGAVTIVRPDPNVLWKPSHPEHESWQHPQARFLGFDKERHWQLEEGLSEGWTITFQDMRLRVKPTPFRHLGIFPEQSVQWQWITEKIRQAGRPVKVLSLFAYTGGASIAAAQAGASVCHVDASAGSVNWAKENAQLSGLSDTAIRWIIDDVRKFMKREVRRGNHYDLIIMDPPVFGRGPKGEIWRLEEGVEELAQLSQELLSAEPLGLLVNFYATSLYPGSIERVFRQSCPLQSLQYELGSLGIEESLSKNILSTGFFLRA